MTTKQLTLTKDFSYILRALRQGYKARRLGWETGQYLQVIKGRFYVNDLPYSLTDEDLISDDWHLHLISR